MKVSLDRELFVVEMLFQKTTAKVQINSQTKEIKEYELQKEEAASNFLQSRGKFLLLFALVPVVVVVLKLVNVF